MRELRTAKEVIDELGGPTATGRIIGRRIQSVVNWRAKDKFPAKTYLKFRAELEKRDLSAPPSLWGQQ